ncbi:MAG: AAA family ATPase, partial [Ignavibacteria bacterium]|nr:AAA family ATPase [Ignavibacteria bacterium]
MLRRRIIKKLDEWMNDQLRKSLIIEGPQQIGKTFVIRSFAYEHYKQVVYINFNQFPYMRRIFEQDFDI